MMQRDPEFWKTSTLVWLSSPQDWDSASIDEVVGFVAKALQLYGVGEMPVYLPAVIKAYRHAVKVVPAKRRLEMLRGLHTGHAAGRFSAAGYLPVMLMDPDRQVAFNAAYDVARYSRVGESDEGTRSRALVQTLSERLPANPGAVLAGLLMFPDAVIREDLVTVVAALSDDELAEAVRCHAYSLFSHVIEFWLRVAAFYVEGESDAEKRRFEIIAKCLLANPGTFEDAAVIVDVTPRFDMQGRPVGLETSSRWVGQGFARRIETRLRILECHEKAPCVMPWVLESWSLEPECPPEAWKMDFLADHTDTES